jgi:uncharacterized protein YegP (UPF0339 family)
MIADTLEVVPAKRGKFIWRFVASNGKQTANNETFDSRANALRALKQHVRKTIALIGEKCDFKTKRVGDATQVIVIRATYSK